MGLQGVTTKTVTQGRPAKERFTTVPRHVSPSGRDPGQGKNPLTVHPPVRDGGTQSGGRVRRR